MRERATEATVPKRRKSDIRSQVVFSILKVGTAMVTASLLAGYFLAAAIVWDILGKEKSRVLKPAKKQK